jgi:putative PIN family toxin of toxin-antitoxin system
MKRLRIVLDTNVLISAAVKPLGLQALVINLVAFRAVQLFVSEPILAEYREVFSRAKFARLPSAEVATLLALETVGGDNRQFRIGVESVEFVEFCRVDCGWSR